jgi:hypothetical protein
MLEIHESLSCALRPRKTTCENRVPTRNRKLTHAFTVALSPSVLEGGEGESGVRLCCVWWKRVCKGRQLRRAGVNLNV